MAIEENIIELAYHPKGNYVLNSILCILKDEKLEFIINEIVDNLKELARD